MSEDRTDQPRNPGRRAALKYAGVAAGAAILGRLTSGIGSSSPTAEGPKSTPASKDSKPAVERETVDLSFNEFISLSHKEQDQKLRDLMGKNVNLQVDQDKATLIRVNSTYHKDGQERSYGRDDKIPEGAQLVSENYILSAGSIVKESTGLNFISFDIR